MVDVSETDRALSEEKGHKEVMLDGSLLRPASQQSRKVGVGLAGYCDGVEAHHLQLPLWAVKPGSGRPFRWRRKSRNAILADAVVRLEAPSEVKALER